MRAIKIDVIKKDVYEIDMEDTLEAIYEALEADDFDNVIQLPNLDILMVDGMGLLREYPIGAFAFALYPQFLSGHGLIQGLNFEGETVPAKSPIELIRPLVQFVPVQLLKGIPTQPQVITFTDAEFREYVRTGRLPLGKGPINLQ